MLLNFSETYTFFFFFTFKVIIDLHAVANTNAERSLVPFTQFRPITCCKTAVQHHNQDTEFDAVKTQGSLMGPFLATPASLPLSPSPQPKPQRRFNHFSSLIILSLQECYVNGVKRDSGVKPEQVVMKD